MIDLTCPFAPTLSRLASDVSSRPSRRSNLAEARPRPAGALGTPGRKRGAAREDMPTGAGIKNLAG